MTFNDLSIEMNPLSSLEATDNLVHTLYYQKVIAGCKNISHLLEGKLLDLTMIHPHYSRMLDLADHDYLPE